MYFMHDNTPAHSAAEVKEYLGEQRVPSVTWPSYSSDLYLIEYVWARIETYVKDVFFIAIYDPQGVSLENLYQIVEEA